MAIHFFDIGLGQTVAVAGAAAFGVAVVYQVSQGKTFWEAVRVAPMGTKVLDIADNLASLYDFYDALLIKHGEVAAKYPPLEVVRVWAAQQQEEIDEQKAIALARDLKIDLAVLNDKASKDKISAETYALMEDVVAKLEFDQSSALPQTSDTIPL